MSNRTRISVKVVKEFVNSWNSGDFDIKNTKGVEDNFVKNVEAIIESFDNKANEIKEVKRVGNAIADEILKVRWLTWTFFPFLFRNCCTDSDLNSAIDDLNYFCCKSGILEGDEND
jgi:hypothetical protein